MPISFNLLAFHGLLETRVSLLTTILTQKCKIKHNARQSNNTPKIAQLLKSSSLFFLAMAVEKFPWIHHWSISFYKKVHSTLPSTADRVFQWLCIIQIFWKFRNKIIFQSGTYLSSFSLFWKHTLRKKVTVQCIFKNMLWQFDSIWIQLHRF